MRGADVGTRILLEPDLSDVVPGRDFRAIQRESDVCGARVAGGSILALREGMTALVSALVTVATILGLWFGVSVLSVPILVLAVRSQERANARLTARMRRSQWTSGAR